MLHFILHFLGINFITSYYLPIYFDNFFNSVLSIHNYNTRSTANQSYYLPRARTNYGIFNIRFQGSKVWNCLGKDIKSTPFSKLEKKSQKLNCCANINVTLVLVSLVTSFFPAISVIYLLLYSSFIIIIQDFIPNTFVCFFSRTCKFRLFLFLFLFLVIPPLIL